DVAFLAVHGPFGEDGTLQGFLEMAGIPYTGAGVLASAVAMDKVVFKDLMRGHGLPVADYTWFRRPAWRATPERVLRDIHAAVGNQSVVKPARLGSSVGMTLVHEDRELPAAIDEALRYDSKVIVERYVAGARELECGVLGNHEPIVFEPGEVRSHHEWYDYESKYVPGLADVHPRAQVEPALAERLMQLAHARRPRMAPPPAGRGPMRRRALGSARGRAPGPGCRCWVPAGSWLWSWPPHWSLASCGCSRARGCGSAQWPGPVPATRPATT